MRKTEWIDDPETLEAFCERELQCDVIAVDTESDHFYSYFPYTCLIQVASPTANALIDPVALDGDELAPLFEIFADPKIEKILHSAPNDFMELDRDFGVTFTNLFDTQLAAEFLRYERSSLKWLLEESLGVKLNKKYQRYDWRRRPIEAGAQEYAIGDVIHLFQLRDMSWQDLQDEGWDFAFEQQCQYLCESVRYEPSEFDPEGWRSVKTKVKLSGRGRATLKALYAWRHELCSELDRAALHVLENHAMVAIADNQPKKKDDLKKIKGISKGTLKYQADAIIDLVRDAEDHDVPPKRRPNTHDRSPRNHRVEKIFNNLKSWRNDAADDYGLPPGLIANNALLMEIAQLEEPSEKRLKTLGGMLPWRVDVFGAEILKIVGD